MGWLRLYQSFTALIKYTVATEEALHFPWEALILEDLLAQGWHVNAPVGLATHVEVVVSILRELLREEVGERCQVIGRSLVVTYTHKPHVNLKSIVQESLLLGAIWWLVQ